jgi:hypothetical protein
MGNASFADLGREHRAKPVPPEPNRLVADVDPALSEQILDVTQRQRVSHIHHHDQTDDLWRAVEIAKRVGHGACLTQPQYARPFALTPPSRTVLALLRTYPASNPFLLARLAGHSEREVASVLGELDRKGFIAESNGRGIVTSSK